MKYFDELKMADIQKAFDSEVLEWKGVTSKPMMGCQCYFRGRKFICFLVTDGIVLMKLSEAVRNGRPDRQTMGHTA